MVYGGMGSGGGGGGGDGSGGGVVEVTRGREECNRALRTRSIIHLLAGVVLLSHWRAIASHDKLFSFTAVPARTE